jgi:lipopolysaccharide export system permease protein
MAILLATFLTLALFSRHNELIAMSVGGISDYKIISPLIISGFCVMFVSFFNQELIMPRTNQQVEYIEDIRIKKKEEQSLSKQNRFWYRSGDTICNIDLIEHKTKTLQGITIFYFDRNLTLIKRVDASSGKWIDNKWYFFDIVTRTFSPDGSINLEATEEGIFPLQETPDDFKATKREPEEMSYAELKAYIDKFEKAGYKVPEYIPHLYAKVSYPFISLIMPILAIPFALRLGRGSSIPLGVGFSVIIGFIYFMFFNFGLSLGKGGLLPPLLSAWAANIIFGTLGTYLFLKRTR